MSSLLPSARRASFVYSILRLLAAPVLDWRVSGRENIPRQGPLLVVINHTSWLDVVLLALFFPRPIVGFAKAEVFRNHPFAWAFRWTKMIPMHRGEVDRAALGRAIQVLREGGAFAIAPEGTRTLDGCLIRAKPGVALLAAASHPTILPIAITGTTRNTFAQNFRSLRRTRVDISIGPQFALWRDVRVDRATRQEIADELMLHIARLLPEAQRGFYANRVFDSPRYFGSAFASERTIPASRGESSAQFQPPESEPTIDRTTRG